MLRFNKRCSMVQKFGWLSKSPPLNGKLKWKRRFFAILQACEGEILKTVPKKGWKQMEKLQEYYLVYWTSENMKARPKRAIPLLSSSQVNKFESYEGRHHHVISLTTNERIYLLQASNKVEMNSWYEHLNTYILDIKEMPCQLITTYQSLK